MRKYIMKYIVDTSHVKELIAEILKKYNITERDIDYKIITSEETVKRHEVIFEIIDMRLKYCKTNEAGEEKCSDDIKEKAVEKVDTEKNNEKYEKSIEIEINKDGVFLTVLDKLTSVEKLLEMVSSYNIVNFFTEKLVEALDKKGEKIKIGEFDNNYYWEPEIKLEITPNNLEAYMILGERGVMNLLDLEKVKKKLSEFRIVEGIDESEILNTIKNDIRNKKILVAKGNDSINGTDASIKYHINTNIGKKYTPAVLADGAVDFKSMELFENVKMGQLLVEKIPATDGIEGKNVFGEIIKALNGKNIVLASGKNCELSEDGLRLISKINGVLSFENGKIEVKDVKVLKEVGISTGNIDAIGNVTVDKNVDSGFYIKAGGGIEVGKNVDNALLTAKESILIRGNFFGAGKGKIISEEGDVIINFGEEGDIEAKKNVIFNDGIMNCNVFCNGKITGMNKRGAIIGGHISAREGIEVINIGSHNGIATVVEVGSDPKMVEEKRKYERETEELKKKIAKNKKELEFMENLLKDSKNKTKLNNEKLTKIVHERYALTTYSSNISKILSKIQADLAVVQGAEVIVHGTCFAGVTVVIRNRVYKVVSDITNVIFYLENDEVKFKSLK